MKREDGVLIREGENDEARAFFGDNGTMCIGVFYRVDEEVGEPGEWVPDPEAGVCLKAADVEKLRTLLNARHSTERSGEEPEGDAGEDLNHCGGCGERSVVWREDRPLHDGDPCAWLREPGIWVFDCRHEARPASPTPDGKETVKP